jgi:hypothetical protein
MTQMARAKKTEMTRQDDKRQQSMQLAPRGNGGMVPAATTAEDEAALLAQMAADGGAGFEEATRDAFAIPFLRVLQDLSPQVKKKMAGYIEGARPGMIFNTATKELFERVRVVPCYYSQVFIEWVPRNDKSNEKGAKGFVAAHPPGTPLALKAVREGAKNVLPNGNELSDTRQHFVLYERPDGSWDQALISLSSSQIKKSKAWMTNARAPHPDIKLPNGRLHPNPPLFACTFTVHGEEEEANEQGSWHVWTFEDRKRVTDPELYAQAAAFCNTMREGKARVQYDDIADEQVSHRNGADAPPRDLHHEEEIDA